MWTRGQLYFTGPRGIHRPGEVDSQDPRLRRVSVDNITVSDSRIMNATVEIQMMAPEITGRETTACDRRQDRRKIIWKKERKEEKKEEVEQKK